MFLESNPQAFPSLSPGHREPFAMRRIWNCSLHILGWLDNAHKFSLATTALRTTRMRIEAVRHTIGIRVTRYAEYSVERLEPPTIVKSSVFRNSPKNL